MFNLILIAFFAIIGVIGLFIPIECDAYVLSYIAFGVTVVYFFGALTSNLAYYSNQLQRFENLHADINKIGIQKKKQNELLVEFKYYLGEKYPEFEKEIFKDITNNNVTALLSYPEIKSSKSLEDLVQKIDKLSSTVCSLEQDLEQDCANIRYYANSKWEIITPKIPVKIKSIVYNELNML